MRALAILFLLSGCATPMAKCDKARIAVEAAQKVVGHFCPVTWPQ